MLEKNLLSIYRLGMSEENFEKEASICSQHPSSANCLTFFISFQGVGEVVSVGDSVPADLKGKSVGYIWTGAFAEYIVRYYDTLIISTEIVRYYDTLIIMIH